MIAILIDGRFVSLVQCGAGGDVLFLHGYLSCKESFYYQIKFLESKGFKVTAPDFPGFGKSGDITRPFSVGDYAEWLKKFIGEAGLNRPKIVAHSFGARVALKLLSEDNSLADKLIITGGAGLVKPRSPAYMRQVKRYRAVKKLFPRFAERHFGSKEYRTLSPVMKESYKRIVNEDLRGCASKIKNQTLLIYGRDDTVTPADEEGRIFNGLINDSKLLVIDGGHFCFSEHPTEFNDLMLEFFGDTDGNFRFG